MVMVKIPDSILTERLLLRCWKVRDAEKLLPILKSNVDHLKDWILERISALAPLTELKRRLTSFNNDFISQKEFRFAIFLKDEKELFGEVSLFPRSADERVNLNIADRVEIGYWLRSDATGSGYAMEASKAMIELSTSLLKMKRIEIRCDAANVPSVAIPKRLGFILSEIMPVQDLDKMIWFMES